MIACLVREETSLYARWFIVSGCVTVFPDACANFVAAAFGGIKNGVEGAQVFQSFGRV